MSGTRYETYLDETLPLVCHEVYRTPDFCSHEANWHEDLEIELITDGVGSVLLDGEKYAVSPDDIVVVNSHVVHYTAADTFLRYDCFIIGSAFCRQAGIDYTALVFSSILRDAKLKSILTDIKAFYMKKDTPCRIARLQQQLLSLLIELRLHYTETQMCRETRRTFTAVKDAIKYIKENYKSRLTLEELSRAVYTDQYTLSREFKRLTGQTVVEYINSYRCKMAAFLLKEGRSVSEAAVLCGFHQLSYFSRTFKRYQGVLPSSQRQSPYRAVGRHSADS